MSGRRFLVTLLRFGESCSTTARLSKPEWHFILTAAAFYFINKFLGYRLITAQILYETLSRGNQLLPHYALGGDVKCALEWPINYDVSLTKWLG